MAAPERKTETVELSVHAGLSSGRSEDTVLSLNEEFEVDGSLDLLVNILRRFHELAERIRDEQAGLKG